VRPYTKLAQLESYLFDEVTPRFRAEGGLDAFDFFCIIIWKANRAKSKIARRLLEHGDGSLDAAVVKLTSDLHSAASSQERLRILMKDWGFLLPMASAILTVLYPTEFTVYDVRVCEQLGDFGDLVHISNAEKVWLGYLDYKAAVVAKTPAHFSLRDRDRELWGRSFAEQLERDIRSKFAASSKSAPA
jgi:hypothetical protein